MMRNRQLVARAVRLMRNDMPLPLNLFADLMEIGIDVDELDRLYRP